MSEIQAIGQFWEKDDEGHVCNPCHRYKVDAGLWPILDDACEALEGHFGQDLIAVYLRGSAARGIPKEYWADLDLVAMLNWKAGTDFMRWSAADDLLMQILPNPEGIQLDLALAHHDPAFPGQNPSVKMLLKTQALCIWGQDLMLRFPNYKPGPEMAIHGKWLQSDLQYWTGMCGHWPSQEAEIEWLKSFWKTAIRAGMEVCMKATGKFSADLYPCLQVFCACHPLLAEEMECVLKCYLDPKLSIEMAPSMMANFLPKLISLVAEDQATSKA